MRESLPSSAYQTTLDHVFTALCMGAVFVACTLLPFPADAAIKEVICGVAGIFIGSVGKAIATLAVIVLGLMGLFGKLSPSTALVTAAGITIMFGASKIVGLLFGGGCSAGSNVNAGVLFSAFCKLINILTGNTARVIAVFGITLAAGGALYGRIQAATAFVIAIAISFIFGASSILEYVLGVGAAGCEAKGSFIATNLDCLLCKAHFMISGSNAGKAMLTFAVIIAGAMALFGKLNWTYAMIVVLGIALIVGGPSVFFHLTGRGWLCAAVYQKLGCSATNDQKNNAAGWAASTSGNAAVSNNAVNAAIDEINKKQFGDKWEDNSGKNYDPNWQDNKTWVDSPTNNTGGGTLPPGTGPLPPTTTPPACPPTIPGCPGYTLPGTTPPTTMPPGTGPLAPTN